MSNMLSAAVENAILLTCIVYVGFFDTFDRPATIVPVFTKVLN